MLASKMRTRGEEERGGDMWGSERSIDLGFCFGCGPATLRVSAWHVAIKICDTGPSPTVLSLNIFATIFFFFYESTIGQFSIQNFFNLKI